MLRKEQSEVVSDTTQLKLTAADGKNVTGASPLPDGRDEALFK